MPVWTPRCSRWPAVCHKGLEPQARRPQTYLPLTRASLALPCSALCEAGAAPALTSLISHRERLDATALAVWREAAAALAAALRDSPSAASSSSSAALASSSSASAAAAAAAAASAVPTAAGGKEDAQEALLGLLLRVKANAHRVLDDDTASKAVGLGLFPAVCLLNHGRLGPDSHPSLGAFA